MDESMTDFNSFPSALEISRRFNLPVFPCITKGDDKATKRPAGSWTHSTDETYKDVKGRIRRGAATLDPPASLTHYGIRMGGGFLAIDLDVKDGKDGISAWEMLNNFYLPEGVEFPPTFTVETPSGGKHLYYRTALPIGTSTDSFGKALYGRSASTGIDVRGERGFVVGPGSGMGIVRYEIIDNRDPVELTAATLAWLTLPDQLGAHSVAQSLPPEALLDKYGKLAEAVKHVRDKEGSPRDWWIDVGFAIYGATGGSHEGLELWADWSKNNSDDPSKAATFEQCEDRWAGFYPKSLGADNIYTWAQTNGFALPEKTDALFGEDDFTESDRIKEKMIESYKPKNFSKLELIDADGDEIETDVQLVDDILPTFNSGDGTIGMLIGASRSGKSTLVSHLSVCLASGRPFLGKEVNRRVGTLILAAEDTRGHRRRVKATRKAYFDDSDDATNWPILQYKMAGERQTVTTFVTWVEAIAEEARAHMASMGFELGLIVLDTFSAGLAIKDENDNKEMADVSDIWRKISLATKCVFLAVHHTGKAQGAGSRGASALPSNADFHLTADADIDERTGEVSNRLLSLTKTRDGETGPIGPYDIRSMTIGHNMITGKTITAGYIVETTYEERRETVKDKKGMSDTCKIVQAAINGMVDTGEDLTGEAVFEKVSASLGDKNARDKRRLFGVAVKNLFERGRVKLRQFDGVEVTAVARDNSNLGDTEISVRQVNSVVGEIVLTDKW